MNAISHRCVVSSAVAACLLAALSVVSVPVWDPDGLRDQVTDDGVSPACLIGSLQSWKGQPCAIFERGRS